MDDLAYIVCLSTDYGDISSTLVHSTLERAEKEAMSLIKSGCETPETLSIQAFSTETGEAISQWAFDPGVAV